MIRLNLTLAAAGVIAAAALAQTETGPSDSLAEMPAPEVVAEANSQPAAEAGDAPGFWGRLFAAIGLGPDAPEAEAEQVMAAPEVFAVDPTAAATAPATAPMPRPEIAVAIPDATELALAPRISQRPEMRPYVAEVASAAVPRPAVAPIPVQRLRPAPNVAVIRSGPMPMRPMHPAQMPRRPLTPADIFRTMPLPPGALGMLQGY